MKDVRRLDLASSGLPSTSLRCVRRATDRERYCECHRAHRARWHSASRPQHARPAPYDASRGCRSSTVRGVPVPTSGLRLSDRVRRAGTYRADACYLHKRCSQFEWGTVRLAALTENPSRNAAGSSYAVSGNTERDELVGPRQDHHSGCPCLKFDRVDLADFFPGSRTDRCGDIYSTT
ncbi:MAG: hypothetical protein ACI9W2_002901 [Gammaproteobacteria bacterium]|jgi:hypothetical protein